MLAESAERVYSRTIPGRRTRGVTINVYRHAMRFGVRWTEHHRVLMCGTISIEWYPA
jgi:hypothetical protein